MNAQRTNGRRIKARSSKAPALAIGLAGFISFLTGCQPHDFPQYPANYREYVYVTNGQGGTLTILDAVNLRLDREIRVGQNPLAVAANPAKNEVYVLNAGAETGQGSVSVVNAENNSVVATIPVLRAPVSIAVNPNGNLAWVANSGSNAISVLDLASRREIARIGTGKEPVEVRLSPDGKTLVVANRGDGSVSIFDAPAGGLRAVFENCPGADDVVILPDSSKAFVACSAGHQVMSIAMARTATSGTQAGTQAGTTQPDRLVALMDVGHAPVQLALKPDGVFLSNGPGDPEPCDYAITATRKFLEVGMPLFGICLWHQILGLASGAKTVKMKFGHRGANHPVQDTQTKRVMILARTMVLRWMRRPCRKMRVLRTFRYSTVLCKVLS